MVGVELRRLDLHLRTPHVSSLGSSLERPVVIARIATDRYDGWGECAALATPGYSEEYADGAWSVLSAHLVPLLLTSVRANGGRLPDAAEMDGLLAPVRGHRMAKACLEMAVLDAGLRSEGRSLAEHVAGRRDRVPAGAVVGLARSDDEKAIATLLGEVAAAVDAGFTRVKVKIAPGDDLSVLMEVRRSFPDIGLQADANGSYRIDDPGHLETLRALDELALLCVEQPLDPDDLVGHARLARELDTPVCLDESVSSLGRLRDAIALQACDLICIKPARLGGLLQAVAAHDICTAAGIGLWCGGMLETTLARSANAAIAMLRGFCLPGDLAGGERFVESDPFLAGAGAEVSRDPEPIVSVHRGPGVGPAPDQEALDLVTARSFWVPLR